MIKIAIALSAFIFLICLILKLTDTWALKWLHLILLTAAPFIFYGLGAIIVYVLYILFSGYAPRG